MKITEHTILVCGPQVAVIIEQSPTMFTVTTYIGDAASVAYETTSYADAEQWAKAAIAYPQD